MTNNWLYTGTVAHKRVGKVAHAFNYPALFLCFPLSARRQLSIVCLVITVLIFLVFMTEIMAMA